MELTVSLLHLLLSLAFALSPNEGGGTNGSSNNLKITCVQEMSLLYVAKPT